MNPDHGRIGHKPNSN